MKEEMAMGTGKGSLARSTGMEFLQGLILLNNSLITLAKRQDCADEASPLALLLFLAVLHLAAIALGSPPTAFIGWFRRCI